MVVTSYSNNIKINPEYSNLVSALSEIEYEQLKDSIRKNGMYQPIIINPNREILDGHHRFRICRELDTPLKYVIKSFDSITDEKRFVIEVNLKRRQLNDFQKAELAYKLEDLEKEKGRERQLSKLKNVKDTLSLGSNDHNDDDDKYDKEKGRTIDIVSKKAGLKPKTYQRAKTILQYGSEEVKEKLRQEKTSISKEFEKIIKDKKRQELLRQYNQDNNNIDKENCKLFHEDFTKIQTKIPDNSIDLILTDPPYSNEFLYLYEDLAKLATRVLKPGGSIVTFVGEIMLPEVFKIFDKFNTVSNPDKFNNKNNLKYWYRFIVQHSGNHQKIHARHIFIQTKIMFWYTKGEKVNDLTISNTLGDLIKSTPPPKELSEWEQSTVEAEYIIKNLTLEKQTILDPMMGTGTTGIAALQLNRKFIGIEINKETFTLAETRIRQALETKNLK